MKLEINSRRQTGKYTSRWNINNTLELTIRHRRNQKGNEKVSGEKRKRKHNTPKFMGGNQSNIRKGVDSGEHLQWKK